MRAVAPHGRRVREAGDGRRAGHGRVRLDASTRELLFAGLLPKGEALAVARIAGIQAAKDTARLIPCATRCR
jgi:molybdenum cofactor biosynthesis enzyme